MYPCFTLACVHVAHQNLQLCRNKTACHLCSHPYRNGFGLNQVVFLVFCCFFFVGEHPRSTFLSIKALDMCHFARTNFAACENPVTSARVYRFCLSKIIRCIWNFTFNRTFYRSPAHHGTHSPKQGKITRYWLNKASHTEDSEFIPSVYNRGHGAVLRGENLSMDTKL